MKDMNYLIQNRFVQKIETSSTENAIAIMALITAREHNDLIREQNEILSRIVMNTQKSPKSIEISRNP